MEMLPSSENARLTEVAALIARASRVVALCGAGISVASGIPDFRGQGGLWSRYAPEQYATIEAFKENPGKVWRMFQELGELITAAEPNPGHRALARLEELGRLKAVVTQNVDGLHQAAGSREVIEFHGSGRELACTACGQKSAWDPKELDELPPRCDCGAALKPDVVLFGEPIPQEAVQAALSQASICQVMLVVGTSAVVAPASHLPMLAKQGGAKLVEINLEPTALTGVLAEYTLLGPCEGVLPALVDEVEALLAPG